MDVNGNKKLIIVSIGLLIAAVLFSIASARFNVEGLQDKIITGFLSILVVVIPMIIREYLSSSKSKQENSFFFKEQKESRNDNEQMFNLFMFGHSGSGKTTFIQRLFTFDTKPLNSTQDFDYYRIDVPFRLEDLNKNRTISVSIADYKGQDVTQVFEAARVNKSIHALVFFADLAPSYSEHGKKLNLDEMLSLLRNDFEFELNKRVDIHRNKYLSEFLLQAVFTYASSDYLKSVRLIINKIDVLERLQLEGIIPKETNLENYVKSLYDEPIRHISRFCEANGIIDFETVIISATESIRTRETFTELLKQFVLK